jgi:uncharacterized protein YciI
LPGNFSIAEGATQIHHPLVKSPRPLLVCLGFAMLSGIFSAAAAPADEPMVMKTYQMVYLRKGTNTSLPKEKISALQQEHLNGLIALNESRTNLLFGSFLDNGDLRGIAVLDVPNAEVARAVFAADPCVASGALQIEARPWYSATNVFGTAEKPHVPENLVFGFLVRATNAPTVSPEEAQKIQKGHLDYMGELFKEGKLIAAGPFADKLDVRGVVIYRVATVDIAKELAASDPAVKAGRLVIDARPWMTFKGLLR